MVLRILIDIFIVFSIFFFPWWVTALFVVLGIFFFDRFYEALCAGVFLDALYGIHGAEFFGVWFVFTAVFGGCYALFEYIIKRNVRLYDTRH